MANLIQSANEALAGFTLAGAGELLQPLLLFVAGIVIYSIFIFEFYRFVAREDVFELDLSKYNVAEHPFLDKTMALILYVIKYIFLFPLFLFFWFIVLSALLTFLTKATSVQSVLLTAMALVGSIRVAAYYNENLSQDLAKMLPFALLGVFLVDASLFDYAQSVEMLSAMPSAWNTILPYFLFLIVLEFILRLGSAIIHLFVPRKEEGEKAEPEEPFPQDL